MDRPSGSKMTSERFPQGGNFESFVVLNGIVST